MTIKIIIVAMITAAVIGFVSFAQAQDVLSPDLKTIPEGKGWKVYNRSVAVVEQDGRSVAFWVGNNSPGKFANLKIRS